MNYRHAYHAGNFADVLKHLVLVLCIEHLKLKPSPFRVIDTHAGIGRYDLTGEAAERTGEWRNGIARLLEARTRFSAPAAAVLAPYLAIVAHENAGDGISAYPGSPLVARRLLRADDRLIANELHPDDRAMLARLFAADPQVKVLGLDAWIALKSLLPPKERRGLVLVDPPYESRDELVRLADGFAAAVRRFATGIYLLWYPIKDPDPIDRFVAGIADRLAPGQREKLARIELMLRAPDDASRLNGCGLVVLNPPHTLAASVAAALPEVTAAVSDDVSRSWRVTGV